MGLAVDQKSSSIPPKQGSYVPSPLGRVREGTFKVVNLVRLLHATTYMNKVFLFLFFFGWLVNAQHQDKVDFIRADVSLELIPERKEVKGWVSYEFEILQEIDSIFLDAKNMGFDFITIDGKIVPYKNFEKLVSIKKDFKKGEKHLLEIGYSAIPKQTLYFMGWDDEVSGNEQIWTQGQGKYTSHWLPSFDAMEEKVEFDMILIISSGTQVIANGIGGEGPGSNDKAIWVFDMQKPMSSYLLAFAIGNYEKQALKSKSGIPIENYYYPQDSLKVEPTYRYTKEIFDYLEAEIGFPYPWQNYKQVPVHDFLYAGMENTSCTIFSDQYVIDSTAFVDKNYVNVNAHELAHQWFGNLVTEKDGNHHWLHEGFATYYAQLAEKEIFGDDHYYWKLYTSLKQLEDAVARGEGQALTDPKASSLTFYEKGAWALYMLRNQIGDTAFRKGIRSYLETYQFKNATIPDFLKEMERVCGKNLTDYKTKWLVNEKLPLEEAKRQLQKNSKSIAQLFSMEADLKKSQSDDIDYLNYWDFSNSIHLKKHMLVNYHTSMSKEIYARALASDTIPVRQALLSVRDIPSILDREELESLLNDNSYITKENALFSLWQKYPENQAKYLDATKDVVGLPNKNVRILWLTLAMLTENYNSLQTKVYFDELSSYTDSQYSFEIRESAFFYLKEAFGLNDTSLLNLMKATEHHAWQFKKFARNLLKELLKDSDYKVRMQKLAEDLNENEYRYLNLELNRE